jgi:hypothetical protein
MFDPSPLEWRQVSAMLPTLQAILSSKATAVQNSAIDRTVDVSGGCEGQSVKKQNGSSELCMGVIRLDLDDPVLQPRLLWHHFVLPRLRSFVETVYEIRRDDFKRYRLLHSVSRSAFDSNQLIHAWTLIHDELPWLLDCDTAFHREKVRAAKHFHKHHQASPRVL